MTRYFRRIAFATGLALVPSAAFATQAGDTQKSGAAITGRAVADGGRPLRGATVWVAVEGANVEAHRATTDGDGRFVAGDLEPGAYMVTAYVPGYVREDASGDRVYRTGDDATLRFVKGGVITGHVLDAENRPVVAVAVKAVLAHDVSGRTVPRHDESMVSMTDDEGQYRIFGLGSGDYVVQAGRRTQGQDMRHPDEFADIAPVFYPSSNRSTAAEVTVHAGEEVGSVDIRFRRTKAFRIAGTIVGVPENARWLTTLVVLHSTGEVVDSAGARRTGDAVAFDIGGLASGDYDVYATAHLSEVEEMRSIAKAVALRTGDVSGIQLALATLNSISGRVSLDPPSGPSPCVARPTHTVAETAIRFERFAGGRPILPFDRNRHAVQPAIDGSFKARSIGPGRVWARVLLPDARWFVKSVSDKLKHDLSANGIALANGTDVDGIEVSVGRDAASVTGRIEVPNGASLPDRATAVLVPVDAREADVALRYFETEVAADGAFTIVNVPPGAYWVLASQAAAEATASAPFAASPIERRRLRDAAAARGTKIDLAPCADVTGIVVPAPVVGKEK